jgi:amino acid transporter
MTNPTPETPRKTLGLTGITINAMALIAPGSFVWLLYQSQLASESGGLGGIFPGVALALFGALLTSFSFGQLAQRYAGSSPRSAYHFAEQIFRESKRPGYLRLAKFTVGWAAHLYYWVYPGVMVAFIGLLADYLLRQLGYSPTVFGQIILAASFAAFISFLALRGITGTTTTSIVLSTVQIVVLAAFSLLAIWFRTANPQDLSSAQWAYPTLDRLLIPSSLQGLLFQSALSMLLVVGFEAVTSLNASAANPRRDIPRAGVLSLIIQGAVSYLLVYFAAGLAANTQINLSGSNAPLGELAIQIGDSLLSGNGFALMFVLALTVFIALLASALTSTNNAVRITFSMSLDREMPEALEFLHPKYNTPYYTVIILGGFSTLVGAAGLLGGTAVIMGLILAANMGAFLLYATLCGLTVKAFIGDSSFHWFKHGILPTAGLLINLFMPLAVIWIGLNSSGTVQQACLTALALAITWLVMSVGYFIVRK